MLNWTRGRTMSALIALATAIVLLLPAVATAQTSTAGAQATERAGASTLSSPATASSTDQAPAKPRSAFARPNAGETGAATGTGRIAPDAGPLTRVWGWIIATQARFHNQLAGGVRRLKSEGSFAAGWFLASISFIYGVLHAAGPGHGKAVISSYVLANERTVRRGIAIAFLAGLFQALSAIILVGIMAALLNMAGMEIRALSNSLEQASYALIALIGAWLLYAQLRSRFGANAATDHAHGHGHGHVSQHSHSDGHSHSHAHSHTPGETCDHCGHAHLPDPKQLEGAWSWREAIGLALAVGIRPCTGAIIVLIFALTQGLFWAGIFATFAMSLGTALMVSLLAALAVGSRELALRYAGGGRMAGVIGAVAGIGGASLVLMLGLVLFIGSLGPAKPF